MLNEKLARCCKADRQHAIETGEMIFIRAAERAEIDLFKKELGEPGGFGPRTLYLVIGEQRRLFVSWPSNIEVPQHSEQDLRVLLETASTLGLVSLVIDPMRSN